MKLTLKAFSAVLSLTMVFAAAFSTIALAEEEAKEVAQQAEVEKAPAPEAAAAPAQPQTMLKYNAVLPEGKTLPEGVARFRAYYQSTKGDGKLYDKDGNSSDLNMKISGTGYAFVAEYGLSDKISLQLVVPYTSKFKMERDISDSEIKSSSEYIAQRNAAISGIADGLVKMGASCGDQTGCEDYVRQNNPPAPKDIAVGEGTIPAGTPVITGLDATLLSQFSKGYAAKEIDGETGMGDVEIGALYNIYAKDQLSFSVAAGLRLPTGKFTDVEGKETGRGTTDLGLRFNIDYAPMDFILLSWQNQTEFMLMKGKKKVGDEEKDFTREGARNHGFLQLAFALGKAHESLKAVGLYTQYLYDYDGEERIDKVSQGQKSQDISMLYGIGVSGLDYGIPVSLNIETYKTTKAKNNVGTENLFVNLKTYYKF